jgi:hypothetical protein
MPLSFVLYTALADGAEKHAILTSKALIFNQGDDA